MAYCWKQIIKLGTVIEMLSICETYCDLRDLTIGKRMFFIICLASLAKRDPQTDVR